ncbi:MAG: L,D-transpeptidase [Verrucomicrobiota bacterium]
MGPKRHRLFSPPDSPGNGFIWLLIVLGLLALGWVWWRTERPAPPKPAARKTAPASPAVARPPAAAPRTNPPPVTPPVAVPVARPMVPSNPPAVSPTVAGAVSTAYPRPVQNIFEAQLALDRLGISSGSLDGKTGSQTRAALRAFQQQAQLPPTGELDAATKTNLLLDATPLIQYTVTSNDLARLQPIGKTWLAKSQQTALDYETLLECVAERSHAHPALIRRLNPAVDWTNGLSVGMTLQLPEVIRTNPPSKAAFVKISLAEKTLQAFDEDSNLLAHFPCSIAARFDKRPVGQLLVKAIAPNPDYTFNPEVFPESEEARQLKTKLILPPGPNNPVGTAWISLDRPGYGMHGTPNPEQVGRTESHGCFRLANWNAEHLIKLVWIGMPVLVEP